MIALLANPAQIGHRAEGHPERPERVTAIVEAIEKSGIDLVPETAPAAPEALIHRVHDPSYVAVLDRAASLGGGNLDPDTYITPLSMVAARTAAGAVVEGVQRGGEGGGEAARAVGRAPSWRECSGWWRGRRNTRSRSCGRPAIMPSTPGPWASAC